MALIYHTVVLVSPCLLRLFRSARRPFANVGTVFVDGCVMVAMINTVVMLDSDHEGYCHRPPKKGGALFHQLASDCDVPLTLSDFDLRAALSLSREHHHHDMSRHRSTCKSLDVVFGLAGLIM